MANIIVRRRSLLLGSAALAVGPVIIPGIAHAAAEVGTPAPLFTSVDSNGKTQSLEQYRGKIVVLETTNHDCPYVAKHYRAGNMQAQQRDAAAKGIVWLTVASSAPGEQGNVTPQQANELTVKRGAAPAAVLIDPQSKVARAYAATVTPHMYIVDAKGILVYKGGIDSIATSNIDDIAKAKQYVRVALEEMAAGKPITEASTRPYGCTLKYGRSST